MRRFLVLLGGMIVLSSMLTDPAAPLAGTGGQIVDPSTGMPVTLGSSVVPSAQQLSRNPMLPQHPLGAYTDAQYEAAVAQLRADTMNKYNDVLRQLGYVDQNGNFVMGSAETSADQKKSQDDYQEQQARDKVTQEMQQNGTLFSGYRGYREGQDTMPFEQDKAQIGIDLPNQLSQLYEQANGVLSDFITQHNSLLADAASRAAQNFINTPPGGSGTGGSTPITSGPPDPSTIPAFPNPGTGLTTSPLATATGPSTAGLQGIANSTSPGALVGAFRPTAVDSSGAPIASNNVGGGQLDPNSLQAIARTAGASNLAGAFAPQSTPPPTRTTQLNAGQFL